MEAEIGEPQTKEGLEEQGRILPQRLGGSTTRGTPCTLVGAQYEPSQPA